MNVPPPIPVRRLLEADALRPLRLRVVAGGDGLDRPVIANPRLQKPGLAFAGYLAYVKPGRIQVIGESELNYLATLGRERSLERWEAVLGLGPAGFVFSKGNAPPEEVIAWCDARAIPTLVTPAATSEAIARLSAYLENVLAPWMQVHGVLVEVFGVGTLIVGDAGIGKSECALELVHRGHRLVADDVVVVRRVRHSHLVGRAHDRLRHFLELRGVGIIDVRSHFGMTATLPEAPVELVIQLERFDDSMADADRDLRQRLLRSDHPWPETRTFLDVEVPAFTMCVAPGRDVAIMVETAVRKCLLAQRGIRDEQEFIRGVDDRASGAGGTDHGAG